MALQLLVLLLALEMEDQDLIPASFADHGAKYLRLRRLDDGRRSIGERQNIVEFHCVVGVAHGLFDLQNVAGRNTILLTTCADHRVHKISKRRATPASQNWL